MPAALCLADRVQTLSFFSAGCVTHRQLEYRSGTSVLRESDCKINESMNLLYWLQHIQHILTEPE